MSLRTLTLLPKGVGFAPNRASGPSKLNPEAPVFTLSNQTATVHQTAFSLESSDLDTATESFFSIASGQDIKAS